MDKVDMLALAYKGFHNLYPVHIHYSEEYGIFCVPRVFPRLYDVWASLTVKLFKNGEGIVHVTGAVIAPMYIPSYYIEDEDEEYV